MSVKNSNDTIGNRTRDLPTCSAVRQPNAPRRTPRLLHTGSKVVKVAKTTVYMSVVPKLRIRGAMPPEPHTFTEDVCNETRVTLLFYPCR